MADTISERLQQSSHPVALLFYLSFRIGAPVVYTLGMWFTSNFILEFILVILLLAADFWNVKNISGRLLVGLRWWNETDQQGESIWVFETADPERQINQVDSKIFWLWLYITPAAWCALGFMALLKLQFLSLILVIIGIALTMTNTMAFTRCDKFGKANDIASNLFGSLSGGVIGRFMPSFLRS